jgi:LmbE family N-acetylglucosaminyl deacetylase
MCILAHPDDESLGTGSTLAKYALEGIEITLVTATSGERGWNGDEQDFPGLEELGKLREAELHCAAEKLGIRQVSFMDYIDGEVDQADPTQAVAKIVTHIRQVRPEVVVTFSPDGGTVIQTTSQSPCSPLARWCAPPTGITPVTCRRTGCRSYTISSPQRRKLPSTNL